MVRHHLIQSLVRAPEVQERSVNVSSPTRPTCLTMTTTVMNSPMMINSIQISSPKKRRRMTMMMTMVETETRNVFANHVFFFLLFCLLICIQDVALMIFAFATGTNCL